MQTIAALAALVCCSAGATALAAAVPASASVSAPTPLFMTEPASSSSNVFSNFKSNSRGMLVGRRLL